MQQLHFISGLPRSGSTLLSALLLQNPRFYAGMSGPLAGMVGSMLAEMSGRNEFSVFIKNDQRERVLKGIFENYYADKSADVIFDTSRGWTARLGLLETIYPSAKVIACVRHMPWIIDSIERLVQRNIFQPSSIFNYTVGGTVYSRVDAIANGDGMVGFPYNALKQAYFGSSAPKQMMILQYETLVSNPEYALKAVYEFINEPQFTHDFNHIDFDATDFDIRANTPGLHEIRPVVGAVERTTVLPPDIFRRFENDAFWSKPTLNPHNVLIV